MPERPLLADQLAALCDGVRDRRRLSEGLDPRAMATYRELVYNNIEGFLRGGFPVLHSLHAEADWRALVEDFILRHRCRTPYFLEIGREFLHFLEHERAESCDHPFLRELAHYEWVELALDVAEDDLGDVPCDRDGSLLDQVPVLSPLAWSLRYAFPVHRIGPELCPKRPDGPHFLLVHRNRRDQVCFRELNAVSARLLELLAAAECSGRQVLERLAGESGLPVNQVLDHGAVLLEEWRQADILLGARLPACRPQESPVRNT